MDNAQNEKYTKSILFAVSIPDSELVQKQKAIKNPVNIELTGFEFGGPSRT